MGHHNYGKLLENAMFLYLKQNYANIYESKIFYIKDITECDFILYDNKEVVSAIQVSHSVEDKLTLKRELTGLINALNKYNLQKGYIVTSEQKFTVNEKNKTIEIIPAYKLFLNMEYDFLK